MCRSRPELFNEYVPFLNLLFEQIANSNEYLFGEIGVDTAENEPLEVLGKIIQYYSFVSLVPVKTALKVGGRRVEHGEARNAPAVRRRHRRQRGPGGRRVDPEVVDPLGVVAAVRLVAVGRGNLLRRGRTNLDGASTFVRGDLHVDHLVEAVGGVFRDGDEPLRIRRLRDHACRRLRVSVRDPRPANDRRGDLERAIGHEPPVVCHGEALNGNLRRL